MTVGDLIGKLVQCDRAAIVTLGNAPGPLGTITETVNGYVILDRAEPPYAPAGDLMSRDAEYERYAYGEPGIRL